MTLLITHLQVNHKHKILPCSNLSQQFFAVEIQLKTNKTFCKLEIPSGKTYFDKRKFHQSKNILLDNNLACFFLGEEEKAMLTGKQKVYLRGLANKLDAITQMGKAGVTEALLKQLDEMLNKRELIKITVLETCELTAREAGEEASALLNAELVQVIGKKFILYRRSQDNPEIILP